MMNEIYLADNTIETSELEKLSSWILKGRRLTKGPLCQEFEQAFSKWQGSKFGVFVNSGSSANLLIAQALLEGGRLRNKTIIAPAVGWVTTVTPFIQLGYNVQLCDCNKTDLGLDTDHLERLCREFKPSAVILVHVLGHACQLDKIEQICKEHDCLLIEDSCEALGSVAYGKNLGSHGLAGSFSFYYGHHISTIEGGMVVTDDEDLYHLMLSIRSHGWGRDIPKDVHEQWKSDYAVDEVRDLYTFYYSGFNLRSTDMNAFLGLSQLGKLDSICSKRARNFELYKSELSDFFIQKSQATPVSSFAYGTLVENRREVYSSLKSQGIESRPLICGNLGLHPFWIKHSGRVSLKNADVIHEKGIYLPNHYNLSEEEIDRVCNVFKQVAKPSYFSLV